MGKPFQYLFVRKALPTTAGTGNYVFQPFTSLPLHSPGGPGITYLGGMRSIQEPQTMVKQAPILEGLNGVAVGEVQMTGLINLPEHMQRQQIMQSTGTLFRP